MAHDFHTPQGSVSAELSRERASKAVFPCNVQVCELFGEDWLCSFSFGDGEGVVLNGFVRSNVDARENGPFCDSLWKFSMVCSVLRGEFP